MSPREREGLLKEIMDELKKKQESIEEAKKKNKNK
jgi:hypothetical protein